MATNQSAIAAAATELPKDVIVDILSRLPVKSLIRFACVCKSWYALLKNPNFITKHFNHTTSNPDNNTYFLYTPHRSTNNSTHQLISFLSNNDAFDVSLDLDIPFLCVSKPFRIAGTCNGLVCLSVVPLAPIILLWNPATRVVKDLPISPIDRPRTMPIKVVLGFGFDEVANDYKVLRIVYCCFPLKQVEMYSLRTNSWREIKTHMMNFLIYESSCSVFLERKFHWRAVGFQELNGKEVIVSFDMDTEVFRPMQLPDSGFNGRKLSWHLTVFKEHLGVITCLDDGPNKKFDVWVMNEYGVTASWVKHTSFGPFPRVTKPLRCGKNGDVLLEKNHAKLVLYDPATGSTMTVGAHGVVCWSDVFVHVQSLLPIQGGQVVEDCNLGDVVPDPYFVRKFDLVLE